MKRVSYSQKKGPMHVIYYISSRGRKIDLSLLGLDAGELCVGMGEGAWCNVSQVHLSPLHQVDRDRYRPGNGLCPT